MIYKRVGDILLEGEVEYNGSLKSEAKPLPHLKHTTHPFKKGLHFCELVRLGKVGRVLYAL